MPTAFEAMLFSAVRRAATEDLGELGELVFVESGSGDHFCGLCAAEGEPERFRPTSIDMPTPCAWCGRALSVGREAVDLLEWARSRPRAVECFSKVRVVRPAFELDVARDADGRGWRRECARLGLDTLDFLEQQAYAATREALELRERVDRLALESRAVCGAGTAGLITVIASDRAEARRIATIAEAAALTDLDAGDLRMVLHRIRERLAALVTGEARS